MARPADWSPLGLHGDPTPGDLDILQNLHTEFQALGDLASEVNTGLDRVLNKSADSFIGKTAEAVRTKIDGHLKKFIASVGTSFSVSGPATLDYLNAVRDAQAKADQALASAQGLSHDDPQLVSLKAQVHDAQDQYNAAASSYGNKLWHAGKIEQPISGWQLFLQALGILAIILAVLGAIFGGWVGLIALAVNVALLIKTAVEFAEGKASMLDLVLAVIGVLFPSTKGLNVGQLSKGLFNALKNLPKMAAGGLGNIGRGITHFFTDGLTFTSIYNGVANLPGLVLRGLTSVGNLALKGISLAKGGLRLIGATFKNDFHLATLGTTTTLGKIGVYAMSFGSRFLVSATLPLDFFELGIGARAAIKMGLGTRLTTPWAHLSQPIVGGSLHVGALAGSHSGFHAANTGGTGFGGLDHGALHGLNSTAVSGLHSTATPALGGLHGLNTGVTVGGLHGVSTVQAVHLGAGVSPDSIGHALAGVGGNATALDHLTAFDHSTGFDRTPAGLLEPMGSHFTAGHVGTTHLGTMNPGTGSATSHLGISSAHNVRTDLTGTATGLHTAISDSMSGVRGAAGHVEDFHALGIPELRSIVDGDVSAVRMTSDGVSMHIGAQSGTPAALHMNFRTMSLTNGTGHQVVVAPEVHAMLGTGDATVTPPGVHGTPPAAASVKDTATISPPVHTTPPAAAPVKDTAVTDVKPPAAGHTTPDPVPQTEAGGAPTGNLDEFSGGARPFGDPGRFTEGPGTRGVTAGEDHKAVSAHQQLDLSGRRDGTAGAGGGHGAPAPTAHDAEALLGALPPTPVAVRPATRPHTGPGGVARPPRSRFEAITGGVGGRIGAERMSAWNAYEKGVADATRAEDTLHDLGGGLDKPSETVDQAAAKLDAQQAGLGVDAARQDLARLDMDVDTIQARLDQLSAPKNRPGDLGTTTAHDTAVHDTSVPGSTPHDPAAHDVSAHGASVPEPGIHDTTAAEGPHTGEDPPASKLQELRAPTHTPERSPIETAPKAPTDAPVSSGPARSAGWYTDRLDGIARDAGMSRADRSAYTQAIDEAVRAGDLRAVAHHYAQFRDHVELTTLKNRFEGFETHIGQGFDRLGDLGADRAAWQAKVDAVHDARATGDLDLQNAALRDYTAFVERHVPSGVLTGKDTPKAFDAGLRRVLGDLATAGGHGDHLRLREELRDLLQLNAFQERLDALRGELGDEEAALHARIGSSGSADESAAALQALHDFRADQDLAARLDALKTDTAGGTHAAEDDAAAALPGFQERLDALRDPVTDPHELQLQRLFDEAEGGDDQARALQDLHEYREERDLQARLDALRHDDGGGGHLDSSGAGTRVSDEELADRFAALGHGEDPHITGLREQAHSAGTAQESEAILDELHAYQDHQEVLRQQRVGELRARIDDLTSERTEHLLGDRFGQADRLGAQLDDLQRQLDGSLSESEKRAELFTELAKGVDAPEAAGHLDRIVDNGLSLTATEHAAGAGDDAERSFEDTENLLNSMKTPDTSHTFDAPHTPHAPETPHAPDAPHTPGPAHTPGTRGTHPQERPPHTTTPPGEQELTLQAPHERPAADGAVRAPDPAAHPVPTAVSAEDMRLLRSEDGPHPEPLPSTRVDTHPQWDQARGTAAPKTVRREWVDPVSHPMGTGAHAPRYKVSSAFDVRRFTLDDRRVTDVTVRIDLAGTGGVAAHETDELWDRALSGVDRVFNAPGHQLPEGDLLHVTLERADGAADAHVTVEVHGPDFATNQHQWSTGATDQDLAHEIGHQLGLRDEYRAVGSEHRPLIDGSLMGDYHRAAPDGLVQGGVRDRYLHLIHDHVAAPGETGTAGGIGAHGLETVAVTPHAPSTKASTSKAAPRTAVKGTPKVTVKGGRSGASTLGEALPQLSFATDATRFTGSRNFKQAVEHYEIKPLVQYDGLAKGAQGGGSEGVRFVATVPATADVDLVKLAEKYSEGWGKENPGALQERFGLVIGLNGRAGSEDGIRAAVEDFAAKWEEKGTFPVAVTGFTWKQPDASLVRQGAQKEIPYGAIRESIVRDELTSRMIDKLWHSGGSGELYLHVGDADVKSMIVGGKPLFDRVTAKLDALAEQGAPPEVLSGGYTLPGATEAGEGARAANAAKTAADLDLSVRQAVAKVDARFVYFPEPNTFVRIDGAGGLEKDISFGTLKDGTFSYEAKEGEKLLDSVVRQRKFAWSTTPTKMAVFDSGLALVTDDGRIGAKVTEDTGGATSGLTQSHAARGTWSDQMKHYLEQYHPEVLTKDADVVESLADIAFHGTRPGELDLARTDAKVLGKALGGGKWHDLKTTLTGHPEVGGIAVATRETLIADLKKGAAAGVSPQAPTASRSFVSPPAPATALEARSAQAVHGMTAEPRRFLGDHTVLLRMDEGLKARTPGLDINHKSFLRWLDDQERHWFTLTPSPSAAAGEKVYLLTPAVEKYVQEYGDDTVLRGIIGGRELPEVGPDTKYIAAHYVPYKTGGTANPLTDIGHRVIPIGRGGEFNPDFVFTGGMNGCALAVTRGPDAETFTAWHYQSPSSNRADSEAFRTQHRPTDWFGDAEYQGLGLQAMPEITNVMWRGDEGWQFLSQEVHASFSNLDDTTLARFQHRPIDFTDGHQWSYTTQMYLRGAEERLEKLNRIAGEKLPLLGTGVENRNLVSAFELLRNQAAEDVRVLGAVHGPEELAARGTELAAGHVETSSLVSSFLDMQTAVEHAEEKARWGWQKPDSELLYRRDQMRTYIADLGSTHWGEGLGRESALPDALPDALPVTVAEHEVDITDVLAPQAPPRPHGTRGSGALLGHDTTATGGHPLSGHAPHPGHTPGHGLAPRLDLDPRWHDARATAPPATLERSWVDPVSRPMGGGPHAPRYEVRSAFDLRRFEVDGHTVADMTVRVDLAGAGDPLAHEIDALWERARLAVDRVFNAPEHRLPNGDLLHVTLERADGAGPAAHLTVEVGGPRTAMNQHQWAVDASGQDLAHEIGHQLGLRDEYQAVGSEHRPHVDGSLMGDYHAAAHDGLSQGGMRDRYLQILGDPVAILGDAHLAGRTAGPALREPEGLAPHAPLNAQAGPSVQPAAKGGTRASRPAGTTVPGTLSFDRGADRFGGSQDFRQAVGHYEITPLVQYDSLAKGAAQTGDGVRFVATVPTTADVDLMELVRKYEAGFAPENRSALNERFGLVIGVNGRPGKEAAITKAVQDFAEEWDRHGTFPVAVTGFTWRQPDPGLVAQGTQKEIPYGAIRESILRDRLTAGMIDRLRPTGGASGEMYLHVGDADVKSLLVEGEPLFDRVTARLATFERSPEVLSGGYRLPGAVHAAGAGKAAAKAAKAAKGAKASAAKAAEDAVKADAAKAAAELDLKVRQAMAAVDARAVYFPEPNTFVRMDGETGMEKEIGFGTITSSGRYDYQALEGRQLLDSVVTTRQVGWARSEGMVVFDSSLALVTDDERIAAEVTGEGRTVLNGLTQSHAARTTWSDQMAHYIGQYHGEVLTQHPDIVGTLTAIAFHDIAADGRALARTTSDIPMNALGGADAWKAFMKAGPAHKTLMTMAIKTRDALVDGLKKPGTAAAVSPPAPGAAHAHPARPGTTHGISPRSPQPATAYATTVAESSRAGSGDLALTEVLRTTIDGGGPLRPTPEPLLPPPFRMTGTHQLSAADRILPSRASAGTLADQLVKGLEGALTQAQRDTLRAGWSKELAAEVWPALSAMSRGEVRKLTMDVGGWTGEVEVTAKVTGAESDRTLASLEFEDGSESFAGGAFQREKLTGLTAGILVKGKAAERTDLTGQLSTNWSHAQSHRVASSGRMFTRTKTAEPALTVGADFVVSFDFSAVRGRFGTRFDLARGGEERLTTVEVPLRVPVATSAADSGIPDLTGARYYLPPLRVEHTLALGGSDTLRDAFLVDADGQRTGGRLDTALLGDPSDAASPAAFGHRTFGSDWGRVRQLVLDRIGSLDVLQFELKGMTAGEAVEIDLGEGLGHLLVTAEVTSMKQVRNTATTEFNTGSDITRVFAHSENSDLAVRATMNAQSADLHAGPGSLTGAGHGQFDREGVTIRRESVRTGTAVKMKVPGVVFDGVATLSFAHRADPLGAAPRAVRAPETTPPAEAAAALRADRTGRSRIGFQVLVDAGEARPVAEATAFSAAQRTAGPRRMQATDVEAGDIAWRPAASVWDGLPPHTVVYDVLTGEEPLPGSLAPAIGDLVDGLGRGYFGSGWSELRPAARDVASREQLAATLPPMTRGNAARSAPLPAPLHSDAQLAFTGQLESLEYLRTLDAAEVNLLSDVTEDVANRLNSAVTQGEWIQGGVQPDVSDSVTIGLHAPGAAYAKRFRSGSGVSGGTNSVASAKYAEPMVAYIARVSVEGRLGRPGDTAAQTGRTEVRFVVAFPKSHAAAYEVAQDAAGHQVFTRPAPVPAPATAPATEHVASVAEHPATTSVAEHPATAAGPPAAAAPAAEQAHPATLTTTAPAPLAFQPPARVTGGRRIGTGDVVVQFDDETALVKALRTELSGTFGDRWDQVEGDVGQFFDGAALQPKTAGLTAGERWGSSFTAGPVTADIRITAAEAEMTAYLKTEKNFEFEQGTESSAAATTSKDTTSRRTLWQRLVVKAPHTAVTLARMRHTDSLTGRTFGFRSGVVSKNKTVEPAALFKGRLRYTVEVEITHLVPGLGGERTFTVTSDGTFAFPARDLPVDPATGTAPRAATSYRPPRRIQESQALGAGDIVLNVSAPQTVRTPARGAATAVDGDLREAVLQQLDEAGRKAFGSAGGWRTARGKLLDRLPASEFQRRLKQMTSGQPWTVRVNGRQVVISASVKEMRHADNTKATEFNSAVVGVVGAGRTQEHLEPQVVATGTNLTVVGTSDPLGAAPAEVFAGGTLAHTTQIENIAETSTATRTAVGTKTKAPGSVFDGVARLHFEFRETWRPFGRTVDKRVGPQTRDLQRRIGELRDALAEQSAIDPAGRAALDLRKDLDQALTDQSQRIRTAVDTRRTTADGGAVLAAMTRRAFGVRRRTFADAEIGFQALVETADAVKAADAAGAGFGAPPPGTVRTRPATDAGPPAATSIPKPPESLWKEGMSGGQLVRDLPDMRSVRGVLDTEGRKAYAGAWDHVTSNGRRRADLVMDAFPKDRLMSGLPRMTRGEELTSEPFLINGRKAWVSAKAEIVGLTHLRGEAKAEVALATENSAEFSRRALHSRQVYLVGQLGALAGASEAKLGAAATFGGGVRRRTRGDQAAGGRVFTNAKIPTPLEHFDGSVRLTFTFHHGSGTAGQAAGVVPFGLSVPLAEITEHVTEAAGHLFLPPEPVKPPVPEAAPTTVTTLPGSPPETDATPAHTVPTETVPTETAASGTTVAEDGATALTTLTPDGGLTVTTPAPTHTGAEPDTEARTGTDAPTGTAPAPAPAHGVVTPPPPRPFRPSRKLPRRVHVPPTVLEQPEPVEEPVHAALPPTATTGFEAVRQQHPDPIAGNSRWTMWGHSGPTPEASVYAVELPALGLRGVYAPPARGEGIGAWHWHAGHAGVDAEPLAVTPLTLRSPGRPDGTPPPAPGTRALAAPAAGHTALNSALDAAPWRGGLHWRSDTEDLYVFGPPGSQARESVFAGGLLPPGDGLGHPAAYARPGGDAGSGWLAATRDIGWLRRQAPAGEGGTGGDVLGRYGWRYDIAAPGGVDVNETLDLAAPHPERHEVLFPGGVDSRYIRGAQRLDGGRPVGPYLTNPGFTPARGTGTAKTEGRQG